MKGQPSIAQTFLGPQPAVSHMEEDGRLAACCHLGKEASHLITLKSITNPACLDMHGKINRNPI